MQKVVSLFSLCLKRGLKSKHCFAVFLLVLFMAGPTWADAGSLGIRLYEQGNYVGAAPYLRTAVNEADQNPNIRYYLADTYLKLNRLAEAQAEYQTILAIAPGSQAARLAQLALSNLRVPKQRWALPGNLGSVAPTGGVDRYTGPLAEGDDYLDEVLRGGQILRWSLTTMPLKLYIEQSPTGVRNFQPSFVHQVRQAMDVWVNVLNRQISYVLVNAPEQADIQVRWVNSIDTRGHSEEGGTIYTAGLTVPRIREDMLKYMDVELATFDIAGRPQDDSMLYVVAVHELGHAMGMLGHSPDPADIMAAQSRQGVTTPSRRDINTLRKLYQQAADINNLPASTRPKNGKRETELAEKLDEAVKKQEDLAKKNDTALDWVNLSVTYLQKGRAVEQAEQTKVDGTVSDPKYWYRKGVSAAGQAIQREPQDPRSYHRRSLLYQALEEYTPALQDIEKAISLNRKEPEYYLLDAWYLAKLKRMAQARSALDTYLLYRPGEAGSNDVKMIQETIRQAAL